MEHVCVSSMFCSIASWVYLYSDAILSWLLGLYGKSGDPRAQVLITDDSAFWGKPRQDQWEGNLPAHFLINANLWLRLHLYGNPHLVLQLSWAASNKH